jgi:type II secretory pathway component PulM
MIAQCKLRWRGYGKRERALLTLCAGLLALLAAQQLILSPLASYQQRAEQRLIQTQRDLLWMQTQRPMLNNLLSQRPQPSEMPLPELLQNSAQQFGVKFSEQNQLLSQPFAPMLSWLTQLESKHGIQAEQLRLNRQPDGLLSGELRFNHHD